MGCCFLLMGFFGEAALPYFSLDQVLTLEELRDQATHDKTLEILIRSSGRRWLLWTLAGMSTMPVRFNHRGDIAFNTPRRPGAVIGQLSETVASPG